MHRKVGSGPCRTRFDGANVQWIWPAGEQRVGAQLARRKILTALSWILFAVFGSLAPVQAAEPSQMDQLRAAYLYQFTKFVTWSQTPRDNLVIALVGNDPLQGAERTIVGKRSQGRLIDVVSLSADSATGLRECCDVIYGRLADLSSLRRARKDWFGEGVLVVSDGVREPGPVPGENRWRVINMYEQDNKLRFDVDLDLATRVGLTLGSELLKNAGEVYFGASGP